MNEIQKTAWDTYRKEKYGEDNSTSGEPKNTNQRTISSIQNDSDSNSTSDTSDDASSSSTE